MTDSIPQLISSHYRVLYGDTDAGGVVYNANYLRFFELGRSDFMRTYVCSYREIEERGLILPVTESFARYKAPAFYDDLVTKRVGHLIVKNRYTVEKDGHVFEIDQYLGENEGTIIAEIEFQSMEEFDLFQPPDWLGETVDVTRDTRYKNKNLTTKKLR